MDYTVDPELRQCNLSAFYEANHIFAPSEPRPLPIVVVTGFLGSGKTTLLGQLLKARANLRIAAVAHDLAQSINVDAAWLGSASEKALRSADFADRDGSVVSLSGCACCDDFEASLKGVVKASLTGGVDKGFLDYVVLETSGAADPRRLIGSLEQQFGPCTRARLDRVIAVVDAETAVAGGECWLAPNSGPPDCPDGGLDSKLQRTQLACADVVLLNKVDLITDSEREMAEARLKQLAPHARVLCCAFGKVPIVDVLDVTIAPSDTAPTVSHELTPVSLIVSPGMEPRPRPAAEAAAAAAGGGSGEEPGVLQPLKKAFSSHAERHLVVEWSNKDLPIRLARLQELLAVELPAWQDMLRRGKGVLWVAEDPGARWEWQASGRLRYSCRRCTGDVGAGGGFGGASPRSSLVLIFSAETPKHVLKSAKAALDRLVEEPGPPCTVAAQQIAATDATFEMLAPPLAEDADSAAVSAPLDACSPSVEWRRQAAHPDAVARFRVTGRDFFGIPEDVDLSAQPYGVDVDGLNLELARLVSESQGGNFLAVGDGVDPITKQRVVALLWPEGVGRGPAGTEDVDASGGTVPEVVAEELPPPATAAVPTVTTQDLLAEILDYTRGEAMPLLKKAYAHVQACRCGQ